MNLADIIALAKQGYKPADIKELVALAEPTTQPSTEDPSTDSSILPPSSEASESPLQEPKAEEVKEEPDYKSMYEESQKALKLAQSANVHRNISDPNAPTDEERFAECVRRFM